MSVLAALVRAYDRLPEAPPFGFSSEKIGFCIVLTPDGSVAEVIDLRDANKRGSSKTLLVPQPWKKAAGIKPNFLWGNTAYTLGVTASDAKRTMKEHTAFREMHAEWLANVEDEALIALRLFLEEWKPYRFQDLSLSNDMLDEAIVFALLGSHRDNFLHDSALACSMWERIKLGEALPKARCLVSGEVAPIARLHPSVKGVWNAHSSGASLVSFNENAYDSYEHARGDNAPISEVAAFAYTTMLNRFLADKFHRIQIADTSAVFWADAPAEVAKEAERLFSAFFDPSSEVDPDGTADTNRIRDTLDAVRNGALQIKINPSIATARFHVLGLSPNAARLSVRFWLSIDFGTLVANFQRFLAETELAPPPRGPWPALWRYLLELAPRGKRENVSPLLASEWMRAILCGGPYPLMLLSTTLLRIRADGKVNVLRAAILRSVLIRNFKSQEAPIALDPANTNKGYNLGRLFAVYEEVQRAALGDDLNATIKDKFYGVASATPRKIYRTLDAGAQSHLLKLRNQAPERSIPLEVLLASIADLMDIDTDSLPCSLGGAEQALFALGYYHQRSQFSRSSDDLTHGVPD